jgi:hypothetical protein
LRRVVVRDCVPEPNHLLQALLANLCSSIPSLQLLPKVGHEPPEIVRERGVGSVTFVEGTTARKNTRQRRRSGRRWRI